MTTARAPGRAAFLFIFITVALDMLALGIVIPVLPKLIIEFQGGDIAAAAGIQGLFGTVWAAMQFFFAPVLGALSDRFGRRPVILLSNLGLGLDYALMAWAPTLSWLFAGRVISGITAASFSTASAYVADVTPPEQRAAKYGMLGAAFGLGFVIGPAVGGLLGNVDLRLPFWVAGGLSLANAFYGFFILPESLPKEKRAAFKWKTANPLGSLKLLRSDKLLFGLSIAAFLSYIAHESLPSVYVLFTDYRFQWTERTVGLALAVVGVCSTIVQAGLIRPIVKALGERKALLVGYACGAISFGIYGVATSGALFLVGIPFGALWGLANPAMQALMTPRVAAHEQGQLQGALSSMRGITGMMGPIIFTQVFAFSIKHEGAQMPGAPWLLATAFIAAAFGLTWWAARQTQGNVN